MLQGIIIKAISGFYYVETEEGVIECKARGKFRNAGASPLVGDRVSLIKEGEKNKKVLRLATARLRQEKMFADYCRKNGYHK